ncbi:GNAT family N-acetyltransferase [Brevibacterium album]|uniref:GNAT family N-acetyltransferase n=1 Tax=Brevibacterium album TaxID=417948 RepID=UPI000425117A|nr:GNAT family N-acetyltransferase [Brevibacterium album]
MSVPGQNAPAGAGGGAGQAEPGAADASAVAPVLLRRMRWWDVEAVAELDAALFGRDAWSPGFFWSQLAAPGASLMLAVGGESPAARDCQLVTSPDPVTPAGLHMPAEALLGFVGVSVSGPQADIMTIGTAPWAQGRGIGRRLLEHASAHARERGAEALYLDVAEGNAAALGLYRSAGFEEIGRRAGYYAEADAILMRAFL